MTGLVISGFGLSAFLFSSIAHIIFPGNTSDFLLLLAIGTSLPMVLGFFFVRPIPLPHYGYSHVPGGDIIDHDESDDAIFSVETPTTAIYRHDHSRTNLLDSPPDAGSYVDEEEELDELEVSPVAYVPPGETGVALSPTTTRSHSRHRSRSSVSSVRHREGVSKAGSGTPNMRGKALAASKMFWVLFVTTSLCE